MNNSIAAFIVIATIFICVLALPGCVTVHNYNFPANQAPQFFEPHFVPEEDLQGKDPEGTY